MNSGRDWYLGNSKNFNRLSCQTFDLGQPVFTDSQARDEQRFSQYPNEIKGAMALKYHNPVGDRSFRNGTAL